MHRCLTTWTPYVASLLLAGMLASCETCFEKEDKAFQRATQKRLADDVRQWLVRHLPEQSVG